MNEQSKYPPGSLAYRPEGDSDGETIGVDHFVLDAAGKEVCVAPNEEAGRLFAAAPDLLAALARLIAAHDEQPSMLTAVEWEAARAAIAKAK